MICNALIDVSAVIISSLGLHWFNDLPVSHQEGHSALFLIYQQCGGMVVLDTALLLMKTALWVMPDPSEIGESGVTPSHSGGALEGRHQPVTGACEEQWQALEESGLAATFAMHMRHHSRITLA